MGNTKNHNCSFCCKSSFLVKKLISGSDAFICDECVMLCQEALQKEKQSNFLPNEIFDFSPKQLKAEFDKYVIGQHEAKKALAVNVCNHYSRLKLKNNDPIKESKVNLLMIGPTSSGKTLLLKVLQKYLKKYDIPVAFADATTLTEAGYVGEDVESVLLRLLQESDFNVQKAQKGIVFIDEIDKITMKSGSSSVRDVSGEGVQQALLGMFQGKIANVSPQGSKRNSHQESIPIDTSEILFICAGAFSGLEKIIESRNNVSSVGFFGELSHKKTVKNYQKVESEDLISFGFIPEFVGRLQSIVTLNELSEDELVEILEKPENAIIKQYKALFESRNSMLDFSKEAIRQIAKETMKKQVSARGLRGVIEAILQDTMFELEDFAPCDVFVDENSVINKKPILVNQKRSTIV